MVSAIVDAPRLLERLAESTARREERPVLDIPPLPPASSDQLVQLFKLLADETRLQILYFLTQRPELNVGALCELLDQSQPAVSHHLALMKQAGMLDMRREGKHNFYRLLPQRFATHAELMFAILPPQARRWYEGGLSLASAANPMPPGTPGTPGISGA